MSKRVEHLDITFNWRDYKGEVSIFPNEFNCAWVTTNGGYPYVIVGVGDKWTGEGKSIVMTSREATQLKDALTEALARVGRMKAVSDE